MSHRLTLASRLLAGLLFVATLTACDTGVAQKTETPPPPPPSAVVPEAPDALDFAPEARAVFRVVACGTRDPLPARLDAKAIETHCAKMDALVDTLQSGWLARAQPFLASLRPAQLPPEVVYPFGGGDLMWAMTTFPDASTYTTISLETAGDPRGIDTIDNPRLATSYRIAEKNVGLQFKVSHSRTDNLTIGAGDVIPSELILDLMALRVYGKEPVLVRYFEIADDGSLVYLTKAKLAATAARDQGSLFANMEVVFKPVGDAAGRTQILRHIAFNLADDSLQKHPGLLEHLKAKGKVAAMTKAASYLLWSSAFGKIRDYLLGHMVWMISDSTGIPPKHALPAGFVQDTYGRYEVPFLPTANMKVHEQFLALWKGQPHRDLPIIYGYPDANHHWHLMVTRPGSPEELAARGAAPAPTDSSASATNPTPPPAAAPAAPAPAPAPAAPVTATTTTTTPPPAAPAPTGSQTP
jgi:hypothetical protein